MNAATYSIAYLNGEFLSLDQVHISPLDRGFLFADGVYEVIPVYDGRPFGLAGHLRRLTQGLGAIRLDGRFSLSQWNGLLNQLVAHNGGGNLALYLQVTRGAAPVRDHNFPPSSIQPTVFAMATPLKPLPEIIYQKGIATVLVEDIRWGACHIKSVALLANVLARQQAVDQGASDAILVRNGILTEGSASNLFLVRDNTLLTPLKDHRILPGITRDIVLKLAADNGIAYREQDIPREALKTASEVWLTSSTKEIIPVTCVNGRTVGAGMPGPLWRRVMDLYQSHKREVCLAVAQDV
jgi:D-alanine transaminase